MSKTDVAEQHKRWKSRPIRPEAVEVQANRAALLRISENLMALTERGLDLALGLSIVQVWDADVAQYVPPDKDQCMALTTDPSLLPQLVKSGSARIYLVPPDKDMLRDLMNRSMGKAPTASEADLRDRVALMHTQHEQLARIIHDVVPPQYLTEVAAQLRAIAGDD
jgi:hypothetical protein